MPTDEPRRPSARATALVTTLIDACEAIGRQQTWAIRSPGMTVKTKAGESARDVLLAYLADLEAACLSTTILDRTEDVLDQQVKKDD